VNRFAESPLRHLSALAPLVALVALAVVVWEPPSGTIANGALLGGLTALFAIGIALIYRANRIVNFAQGDMGAVPATLVLLLMARDVPGGAPDWMTDLPYPAAFAVGLVGAIFLSFVLERTIINRFKRAPRLILTVATIGVAQLLIAFAIFMPRWFNLKQLGGEVTRPAPPIDVDFTIGGDRFDGNDLMVVITVPVILVALALFMRYTRVGIAVRAAAERADRAATLGVPVHRVQTTVWVITGVLAFVTVFLQAGIRSIPLGSALGITMLVRALAAAVIGRMEDFPRIAAAAIGLGIVEQSIIYRWRDVYVFPVLFAIIVVAMLLNRRHRGSRVADQAVSSWAAARELRRIPTELRTLPEVRIPVIALFGVIAIFLVSLPLWMSNPHLVIAAQTGTFATIGVSLVVLTGWGGHVSLGHMAFAAIGGAVGAWVTQTAGWDLGWALLAGGVIGAVVAVVVGIPAARAGGLTLAIITLALASATLYWLLNPDVVDWVPRGRIGDTNLLLDLRIESQTSFYFLNLGVLAIAVAMAYGIRRTRTGRVLIALRENPRAVEAYGVNPFRTMLVAFAFSGFLAAVAGVLFVHHLHLFPNSSVNNPLSAEASLRVFTIVVIGGLASIPGAIIGTLYVFSMQYYMLPEWRFLANGFGLLLILLILPGGIGAGLAEARDAWLRWVARRKNLLVPSLVADRRVEEVEVTPAMAAAVADTVERPELEEVAELRQ